MSGEMIFSLYYGGVIVLLAIFSHYVMSKEFKQYLEKEDSNSVQR